MRQTHPIIVGHRSDVQHPQLLRAVSEQEGQIVGTDSWTDLFLEFGQSQVGSDILRSFRTNFIEILQILFTWHLRSYKWSRLRLANNMKAMGNALGRSLVHLLRFENTVLHDNVRQVGEEQNTFVEARGEQGAFQLLEDSDTNIQRIRVISQHQFIPQMQDFVQRENV